MAAAPGVPPQGTCSLLPCGASVASARRKTRGWPAGDGVGRERRVARTLRRAAARRRAATPNSEAGFSILEVAVALTILLTALVSVSSLMGTIFKVGANSRFEQEATEIAVST